MSIVKKVINYPNSKKNSDISKKTNNRTYSNRGMSLEKDLKITNQYYLDMEIAAIYKKPTPIQIVKVDYPNRQSAKITEAYYVEPSTTDYNGIYQGKYLDFEAKETKSKTAFPLNSIHQHQIEHLKIINKQKGISFVIIRFSSFSEDYLLITEKLLEFIKNNKRKSIPYQWIKKEAALIPMKFNPRIDYLCIIDKIYNI
ncbi:MAG: Holliday junction resolvase RecU [Erysipelotrichaceae bacterium]